MRIEIYEMFIIESVLKGFFCFGFILDLVIDSSVVFIWVFLFVLFIKLEFIFFYIVLRDVNRLMFVIFNYGMC